MAITFFEDYKPDPYELIGQVEGYCGHAEAAIVYLIDPANGQPINTHPLISQLLELATVDVGKAIQMQLENVQVLEGDKIKIQAINARLLVCQEILRGADLVFDATQETFAGSQFKDTYELELEKQLSIFRKIISICNIVHLGIDARFDYFGNVIPLERQQNDLPESLQIQYDKIISELLFSDDDLPDVFRLWSEQSNQFSLEETSKNIAEGLRLLEIVPQVLRTPLWHRQKGYLRFWQRQMRAALAIDKRRSIFQRAA